MRQEPDAGDVDAIAAERRATGECARTVGSATSVEKPGTVVASYE